MHRSAQNTDYTCESLDINSLRTQ